MTKRKKSWWKNHWDDVLLIVFIGLGILLMMWSTGYFG